MSYGYIYKISTTATDKVYIGQTTRTVAARFKEHLNNINSKSKKTLHLYLAMAKYGVNTFSAEQIDSAETRSELNAKEQYWIQFYDSINNGYNMTLGGETSPMLSEVVKEKHDNKLRSSEVRNKISNSMHIYRTTVGFSSEHLQKIKDSRRKRLEERRAMGLGFYDNPASMASRSKAVYCILDTGERFEFDSILHAGKWWFDNYKPFGDSYSVATYQRKIEDSIAGREIKYCKKDRKTYIIITNINWYYIE